MKFFSSLVISAALLAGGQVQADEVVAQTEDNSVGGLAAGFTGFLLGGAAGGPVGALVGGGLGLLAGSSVQDASGLSQRAYVVKTASGEEKTLRSPNAQFQVGEQVIRRGGRLHPEH
ncbi:MAG TPA: hypothetical protein VJA19_04345 [Pseudomonas sp.]|nr:hypothetical protein [Pseudomonas sp.]